MVVATILPLPRPCLPKQWRALETTPPKIRLGFQLQMNNGHRHPLAKAGKQSVILSAQLKPPEEDVADPAATVKPQQNGLVNTWFNDAYQYKAWPEVHRLLTERNVEGVEWQEAYELSQSGAAILIDVREAQHFEKIHATGSFGAPLFQLIQGDDLKANMRRLGYALITDFSGTERNPNFVTQALEAVEGDVLKPVIVVCDIGGTLSTFVERKGPKAKKYADPERRFGRASRSLKAVFELLEAGFKDVSYLSGGLKGWIHEDLPTEESER